MLKLCDLKDPGQSVWLVAPKVTIGRGSNCDMIIADDSVAKLHAEVIVEGEQLLLRHLAERGRTLLNGKPVQKSCPLKCNDELQIGERTLKVLDPKVTKLKKTAPASNVTWALRANHPGDRRQGLSDPREQCGGALGGLRYHLFFVAPFPPPRTS